MKGIASTELATNKKSKAAVADMEKCIGCGVCVYKCPTRSLVLVRREETSAPPGM